VPSTVVFRTSNRVAEERGTIEEFRGRVGAIRERHARKGRFIDRLSGLG
jgi:hypothetical protein